MKKQFIIGGAIVGLLYSVGVMLFAFIKAPGRPGIFEFLLQVAIVGVFVLAGALVGFLAGWLISLCVRKK